MAVIEGIESRPSVAVEDPPPVKELTADQPAQQVDDVLTIEEARTVIKQLKDRCRFQTHQTLMWRKKAKMQEERLEQMRIEYGSRLESLTSDLLLFEARLSRKQRAIGELLEHRECVIERQQHAIRCLHSRLAGFGVTATGGGPGGCGVAGSGGCGGQGCDDGNVDDSDSAVIMEEDESGNSQEDATERHHSTPTPPPPSHHQQQHHQHHQHHQQQHRNLRTSEEEAVVGARPGPGGGKDGGGRGENVTAATTYNRVMSNHRSVTKPKDVKYKRINKAKSKSLEELRGRLKNWVDRGQRMSLTVDPTYG